MGAEWGDDGRAGPWRGRRPVVAAPCRDATFEGLTSPARARPDEHDRNDTGAAAVMVPASTGLFHQERFAPVIAEAIDLFGGPEAVYHGNVYALRPEIAELRSVATLVVPQTIAQALAQLWCRVLLDENVPAVPAVRERRTVSVFGEGWAGNKGFEEPGLAEGCIAVPIPAAVAPDGTRDGVAGALVLAFHDPSKARVEPDDPRFTRLRELAAEIGAGLARGGPGPLAEHVFAGAPEPPGVTGAAVAPGTAETPGILEALGSPGVSEAACTSEAMLTRGACRPGAESGHPPSASAAGSGPGELREALDGADLGTWRWDFATGRITLDSRTSAIFTAATSPYDGPIESVLCALSAQDYPGLRLQLTHAITTTGVYNSTHRVMRDDGETRWIEVRGGVVRGPDDAPLRITGVASDATDAEDLRRSLVRQAEEVDAGVMVIDDQWRLVYCNTHAERFFCRTRAEIIGRRMNELVPDLRHRGLGRHLFKVLEERQPHSFTVEVPENGRRYRVRAYPRGSQILVFAIDVSDEHAKAAKRREQAQAQATRQARLQLLTAALAESLTVREVMRAARRIPAVCGADGFAVTLVREARLTIIGQIGYPPDTMGTFMHLAVEAPAPLAEVAGRRSMVTIGSREEFIEKYPHLRGLAEEGNKHTWVYWPLVVGEEVVGTAVLSWAEEHEVTSEEKRLFTQLRGLLARALQRARRYDDEHAMSSGLQRGLLPGRPVLTPGLTVATRYLPATVGMQIGGDWHDVISLPGGDVGLVIGDVQGHGVDAAAVMSVLRTAVLAYAVEGHDPAEVIRRTNTLTAGMGTDVLATCTYVQVDPRTGHARAVRAGHPHPAVLGVEHARLHEIEGGLPLGIDTDAEYPVSDISLVPGDILVLCTDGLVEARGLTLDDGTAWLLGALERGRGLSPDDLAGNLVAGRAGEPTPSPFGGPAPLGVSGLGDDVALLVARYDGPEPAVMFV